VLTKETGSFGDQSIVDSKNLEFDKFGVKYCILA
jgi:hypothetical protein